MHRELIHQLLEVLDWPLLKPGDEKFFGYVVALGVFPHGWDDPEAMTQYVDFSYGDSYKRYRLPNDASLKEQLRDVLWDNLNGEDPGDIYGKVWIKRLADGYAVDLP